jgi:hypothetical protein
MYQQTYFVSKRTGTFADVLVAYGLAAVLDEVMRKVKGPSGQWRVWLRDAGPYYTVELSEPLVPEWVGTCSRFTLVPFVQREGREKNVIPPLGFPRAWIRDLTTEREDFYTYLATSKQSGKAQSDEAITDVDRAMKDLAPKADFRVLECVGDWKMQATGLTRTGFQSYNALAVLWWETSSHLADNIEAILEMCSSIDAELEDMGKKWAKAVGVRVPQARLNASQLLNPAQGQGQNHPKANRLDTRNQMESFWLLEYLKAAGLWICGAPRQVAPAKDHPSTRDWRKADRKTYVLAPMGITLAAHCTVFDEFNARLRNETSIKMDIIGSLLFVHTWLDYVEGAYKDELDFDQELTSMVPESVVAGFHVAQYKQLSGQSYTMTNLSFLGLPAWTGQARNRVEVLRMKEVIEEHLNVIRGIDEGRSDGYNLLLCYRDFVAGGKWGAFFDFAIGYSHYLVREQHEAYRRGRNPRAWQFSMRNLEELMKRTNKPLTPIIQNEGFRNIARAIRLSTVTAQYYRYQRNDRRYDVRYGLGQELARKAHDAAEFIAALGDFLHKYNAESAQVEESTAKQYKGNIPEKVRRTLRGRVSESNIAEVVALIDEYGPEPVCHLLVACGYARGPKDDAAS